MPVRWLQATPHSVQSMPEEQTHWADTLLKGQHLTEHASTCPRGVFVCRECVFVSKCVCPYMYCVGVCGCEREPYILRILSCCSFPVQRQNKHIKAKRRSSLAFNHITAVFHTNG